MKLKPLMEDIIGKDKIQINIVFAVNRTKHGRERQDRHVDDGGERISEQEITSTVKKAIPKITGALIQDEIDIKQDKI